MIVMSWQEEVVAYFKVLFWRSLGVTEDYNENNQSSQPVM
jgi:hypothetical protein